jgi:DNA modification methylase
MINLNEIYIGDWVKVMKTWPDNFVQCIVTSPPYWSLRDYGTAGWEGGDPNCDHITGRANRTITNKSNKQSTNSGSWASETRDKCPKCGATRIDQQLGLEKTPELYIEKMVAGFREVRRIMRPDGTLWLNIGYKFDGHGNCIDLPHMVKDALVTDGWYFKCPIVWEKPNPMPSSQKKRPTVSQEMIFLMAKDPGTHYHYDQEAVSEPQKEISLRRAFSKNNVENRKDFDNDNYAISGRAQDKTYQKLRDKIKSGNENPGRNLRSVWTIPTQGCKFEHYASFPEKLVNKCILAGTSPQACGVCGAPYERVVEKRPSTINIRVRDNKKGIIEKKSGVDGKYKASQFEIENYGNEETGETKTIGFRPTCEHNDSTGKCVVLDPFCGTNTTGYCARILGQNWIGIELSEKYAKYGTSRIKPIKQKLF